MKYQSELIKEIVDTRGHKKSSLHYQSECEETWIEEAKGAYPKLCDYESEWLNYISILDDMGGSEDPEPPIGEFPYETVTTNTAATVNHVVPYAYKTAILYGKSESTDGTLQSVKMPVLTTTGKNLVNSKIEMGNIKTTDGKLYDSNAHIRSKDYIPINPSTNNRVTLSNNKGYVAVIFQYNENHVLINYTAGKNDVTVATLKDDCRFIKFRTTDSSKATDLSALFQLEYGSINSSYEPYKSNILSTTEDVTLRGIGDVRDELDCLTGEVTERIGEIVLDGSENWRLRSGTFDNVVLFYNGFNICPNGVPISEVKSDRLISRANFQWIAQNEGIYLSGANEGFFLSLSKERNIDTTDKLKQWLSQNELTVQYRYSSESVKTVDLTITNQDGEILNKLKPIEGTMHITPTGEPIAPTAVLEVPVEAITQNLASFIGEE